MLILDQIVWGGEPPLTPSLHRGGSGAFLEVALPASLIRTGICLP